MKKYLLLCHFKYTKLLAILLGLIVFSLCIDINTTQAARPVVAKTKELTVFDNYLSYFDMTYKELGLNPNKAGNTLKTKYPLDKARFLGEKCFVSLWFNDGTYASSYPSMIEIGSSSFPSKTWYASKLKDELEKELGTKAYDIDGAKFSIDIPDTGLYITVIWSEISKGIYIKPSEEYNRKNLFDLDESIIKKNEATTEKSLSAYINVLGRSYDDDGGMSVSEDFINNLDNVFLMGSVGTVEHGYTEDSNGKIDLMDWLSNEAFSAGEFEVFVKTLDGFFGTSGVLKQFDNISDRTYFWEDPKRECVVISWLDGCTVNVRWKYEKDHFTKTAATPTPTSTPKPVLLCEVDRCYNSGTESYTNPFSGKKEYYCEKHYDEMMEDVESILSSYCGMDGCYNKGTKKWVNFSGVPEYYCEKHYAELQEALEYFGF